MIHVKRIAQFFALILSFSCESAGRPIVEVEHENTADAQLNPHDSGSENVVLGDQKSVYDCSSTQNQIVQEDRRVTLYALRAFRRIAIDTTVQNWFRENMIAPGFGSPGVTEDIRNALDVIEGEIQDGFSASCNRPYCDSDTNAFVGALNKINLCSGYFANPRRYRASVITHEAAHYMISAEDYFYNCGGWQVHNLASRHLAYPNVRDNVADFYSSSSCNSGPANPSCSDQCVDCNRCVLPHRNAEWWEAATMLSLGVDIDSLYSSHRGTSPSETEFDAELERIAINDEDPRDIISCIGLKLHTTWGAPSKPSQQWWDAVSAFRSYAISVNPENSCEVVDLLFQYAGEAAFTFYPLYEGIVVPTPDGDITFGDTGALMHYLDFMAQGHTLAEAHDYFRGVSTAIALTAIL